MDLSYDVIPSATCSDYTLKSFAFFIQPLVQEAGSRRKLAQQFQQPEFRKRVHRLIEEERKLPTLDEKSDTCWLNEMLILSHRNDAYKGKYLAECAQSRGVALLDCMMDLFAEDPDMVGDMIAPDFTEAVDRLCMRDNAMPCSDGSSYPKNENMTGWSEIPVYPNPMNIGYIPRYLKRYGRFPAADGGRLEWAVRQASGYPAQRFNIEKRGMIREGWFADLVVMDLGQLRSHDEEEDPLQDPEGIEYVIVNGAIAVEKNQLTGDKSGRVLRRGRE